MPGKKKHHRTKHRRNGDGTSIPDHAVIPLAPIQPPFPAYPYPTAHPRRSRGQRVADAVRRKASKLGDAITPEAATINKDHVLGVGANAAGGIGAALLANEFVDDVGVMPMAVATTVAGAAGSVFLKGNWQRICQGLLGAGVGQLGVAFLTERGLKKAAKAAAEATTVAGAPAKSPQAPPRNAYLGGDDEDRLIRAMERTERRLNAIRAEDDVRNAYGDTGLDGDLLDELGGYPYVA